MRCCGFQSTGIQGEALLCVRLAGALTIETGDLLIVKLVDIHAEIVHAQPELGAFLVLDLEIGDAVHLEVLRNVQVVGHSLITKISQYNGLSYGSVHTVALS